MEVSCQVSKLRPEGEPAQPDDVLITCAFTMVSLDPATKKYVSLPQFISLHGSNFDKIKQACPRRASCSGRPRGRKAL